MDRYGEAAADFHVCHLLGAPIDAQVVSVHSKQHSPLAVLENKAQHKTEHKANIVVTIVVTTGVEVKDAPVGAPVVSVDCSMSFVPRIKFFKGWNKTTKSHSTRNNTPLAGLRIIGRCNNNSYNEKKSQVPPTASG
ncbi:hypothetical protein [Paenibacillus sp. BK033]|uniref:hypothetical protein n=1 Tax=Paenibacillus sp. BK033 TaxID=2512133 RepID=UPI0010526C7A|nr:hypothetical protein [Paenibacillus sp. BK033]